MNAFDKHPCPCCNFSTLEMKANNTNKDLFPDEK
jgi:hypothetical protein